MKIVQVTYTTTEAYVAQNQSNIQKVMADLQELNYQGMNYNCCLGADGKTFTHTAFFKSDADEQLLFALESFKNFREQLKASRPETAPKQQIMTLVGTSTPIFNH